MSTSKPKKSVKNSTAKYKAITCSTCKKFIKSSVNLRCSQCKKTFDLSCADVSTKNFNLMTNEKKITWCCSACRSQKQLNNSTMSTPTAGIQIPPVQPQIDLHLDNSVVSTEEHCISFTESHNRSSDSSHLSISNHLRRSLPDLSTRHDEDTLNELKKSNEDLKLKLDSANLEIENLILEKNKLERKIAEQDIKINNLIRICSTKPSPKTPNSTMKIRRKDLENHRTGKDNTLMATSNSGLFIEKQKEQSAREETVKQNLKTRDNTSKKNLQSKDRHNGKQIKIFGTQQIRNLASNLIQSRINNKYESYKIFSTTKPQADAAEVLRECTKIDIQELDKLDKFIICVGENDKNPMEVLSNVHSIVKKLKNCSVIVLNVVKNRYINTNILNEKLEQICKNNNCYFINDISEKCSMYNLCNKINRIIDTIDYDHKYLNLTELKKHMTRSSNNIQPKSIKGTIPYLFARMIAKSKQNLDIKSSSTSNHNTSKRGTIPFYFPKADKNFFRN